MKPVVSIAFAAVVMLAAGLTVCRAQGSASTGQAMPNSNMAPPSGNTGGANNGIGQQGNLTRDAGSHSSTLKGAAAAAQIPISPTSPKTAHNDADIEKDPAQGGSKQH